MEVAELLGKALKSVISDALEVENSTERMEMLSEIGGLIPPKIAATSFELMERGKVRELVVPRTEIQRKTRNFEDFTEKTNFNWKIDLKIAKNPPKIIPMEERRRKNYYIEVEHCKKRETLQFLFPNVHFCHCQYFHSKVLTTQEEWCCVHLLAYYLSENFGKIRKIECKTEMATILRRIWMKKIENEN